MRRFTLVLGSFLIMTVAGCANDQNVGLHASLECVPFARALSGIALKGDASDWWREADGRYARGTVPAVGSVLVLSSTQGLPRGHIAVVSAITSPREILVTQANWVHHRVTSDQPVVDVSPGNDWSTVRVWWPPSGSLGSTEYPVSGFIYSPFPTSHERVVQTVPEAVRVALGEE